MSHVQQKLSAKQTEILNVVIRGNGYDSTGKLIACDLDQLITRLSYTPSKESMQFSVRAMMKRGLIYRGEHENRRGRRRVLIVPTDLGQKILSYKMLTVIVAPEAIPGAEGIQESHEIVV